MSQIPITRSSMPTIDEYTQQISELWRSRWLTNTGVLHEALEKEIKNRFNASNFLLFANGHMALEFGIQAFGLSGEVITTPFTFASTTQAIVRNGLTPVFCDIDPDLFTIDAKKIEALITERTSAIVAVHVYGMPCNTDVIESIAEKYRLKVIYDAAHAFDVKWRGKNIAEYGDLSMFSFHATKVFHTIEGGGATFSDSRLYGKMRRLRDFGLASGGEDADEIGGNAKMSEFHAAMGLCNLRYIENEISKRKVASERYDSRFKDVNGLQLLPEIDGLERNYSYYPIVFLDEFGKSRDEAADLLKQHGIMARKYFYPLTSSFKCYEGLFPVGATPVAEDITRRILCLPLYTDITAEDIETVCNILLK